MRCGAARTNQRAKEVGERRLAIDSEKQGPGGLVYLEYSQPHRAPIPPVRQVPLMRDQALYTGGIVSYCVHEVGYVVPEPFHREMSSNFGNKLIEGVVAVHIDGHRDAVRFDIT